MSLVYRFAEQNKNVAIWRELEDVLKLSRRVQFNEPWRASRHLNDYVKGVDASSASRLICIRFWTSGQQTMNLFDFYYNGQDEKRGAFWRAVFWRQSNLVYAIQAKDITEYSFLQ